MICDQLVYVLKVSILGQTLDEIINRIADNADWWQALKERRFPKWALKRWPVRNTIWNATCMRLYPDIPIPKDHTPYLRVDLEQGPSQWAPGKEPGDSEE